MRQPSAKQIPPYLVAYGLNPVKGLAMKLGHSLALDGIGFTDQLPKTRGRKIVRRLLREIVTSNGAPVGDVTTREDMNVLKNLASQQDED